MRLFAGVVIGASLLGGGALAADFTLPATVSWTTLANEPLAGNQAAAIAAALRTAAGVELRLRPAGSDAERAELLRQGVVDFEATAVGGSVGAQEGAFAFAGRDLGPQRVRLVLANMAEPINYEIAVAGDLGIAEYSDLRGKRVAWYTNFPVVNVNTAAYLAYGGLTWDDVQRVEIGGFFDAALAALARGELDAAFADTVDPAAVAAAAGPRGLFWPQLDPQNHDGMARLHAVAPYFVDHDVADGAALVAGQPHHGAEYPYPILIALAQTDADLVFNMTKALVELYPDYEGDALGIEGWRVDPQTFLWFVPYHEGAVAYFKQMGLWTDAAQAHNDALLARQDALAAAWAALTAENPADWAAAWEERRHQALIAAGFQVVF